jgi:protein-tyrosine phosphatase
MLIVKNKAFFEDLHDIADAMQLSFVHCPIMDCGVIDDTRILQLAYMIAESLTKGDIIYMHCWGGNPLLFILGWV